MTYFAFANFMAGWRLVRMHIQHFVSALSVS